MNGLIILNKEKGYTSFDCVAIAKKVFKTKKVGHLGTLDPDATGVLVLCINDATKLAPFLESDEKEYVAEVLLGRSTDTYDASGKIIEQKELSIDDLDLDTLDNVLKTFLGHQKQIPPMYSAIKINGQKMYNLARNNIIVDIPPRDIEIKEIERLSDLKYDNINKTFSFVIRCVVSKGTYIRSLCYDIGKALNMPSLMNELNRKRSGSFELTNSVTIEELKNNKYNLISMLDAFKDYKIIEDEYLTKLVLNGVKLYPKQLAKYQVDDIVIFKKEDKLIAIYQYDEASKMYKASRVWN